MATKINKVKRGRPPKVTPEQRAWAHEEARKFIEAGFEVVVEEVKPVEVVEPIAPALSIDTTLSPRMREWHKKNAKRFHNNPSYQGV